MAVFGRIFSDMFCTPKFGGLGVCVDVDSDASKDLSPHFQVPPEN